jgi:general secretion pathway protein E
MEITALTNYILTTAPLLGVTRAQITLPFSPVKLALLIGWAYFSFYASQYIHFNKMVSEKRTSIAKLAALVVGPILLPALIMISIAKRSEEEGTSAWEVIKKHIGNTFANIAAVRMIRKEDSAINLFDSAGRNIKDIYGHGKANKDDRHVLNLTEQLLIDALDERASDILIDPKDQSTYTIRFRIDGVLRTIDTTEAETCQAIINSIKAVSSMDIAEKRRPQDGAFVAEAANGIVSFRVASAGALNGEKLSLRVLSQNAGQFQLTNIGLSEKQQKMLKEAVAKPSGMILLAGPTGSGKTTTLYAMLNKIDFLTRNVVTVEDPIEYVLPNVSQIEINPKADITFANSLRSILRQDPDVICVGEIRDEETAGIALRAAQTGHLVIATIHSNSNASSLIRLLDLSVSPLLLSSGLDLVISQRLVRCLCPECKVPAELPPSQIREFVKRNINYTNMQQPAGCDYCNETGYYGRIAIFDPLVVDNNLKTNIANQTLSVEQLKKDGDRRGRSNLRKQGLKLVVSGITSIQELNRVVG